MFWVSPEKTRYIKIYIFTLKFIFYIGNNRYLYTGGKFQFSWKYSNRMKKFLPKYVPRQNVLTAKVPLGSVPRQKISRRNVGHGCGGMLYPALRKTVVSECHSDTKRIKVAAELGFSTRSLRKACRFGVEDPSSSLHWWSEVNMALTS